MMYIPFFQWFYRPRAELSYWYWRKSGTGKRHRYFERLYYKKATGYAFNSDKQTCFPNATLCFEIIDANQKTIKDSVPNSDYMSSWRVFISRWWESLEKGIANIPNWRGLKPYWGDGASPCKYLFKTVREGFRQGLSAVNTGSRHHSIAPLSGKHHQQLRL
jgi:hypothetical protein